MLNEPDGADQILPVALPPILPARVAAVPWQMVWGDPALAVGVAFTVITTVLVAGVHAGPLVVNVKVTVPDVIDGV